MAWKLPILPRREKRVRLALFVGLLVFELLLVGWAVKNYPPGPNIGFIVKNGPTYLLAYKDGAYEYEIKKYDSLEDALRFAREDLELHTGHNPIEDHALEHLWLKDRSGTYQVFWKTWRHEFLNRLTFQKETEAKTYFRAFQAGAYAPSLFGHAILLTR